MSRQRYAKWIAVRGPHLIIVGSTQRDSPCKDGSTCRLPPGNSIQRLSQTSPRTFAYEVRMSAMITSEKKIGRPRGGKKHRLKALSPIALHLEKRNIGGKRDTHRRNESRSRRYAFTGAQSSPNTPIIARAGMNFHSSAHSSCPPVIILYTLHVPNIHAQ